MKIYTKQGDLGTTSGAKGVRLPKTAPLFALLGDLDELQALIGVSLTLSLPLHSLQLSLAQLQKELYWLCSWIGAGVQWAQIDQAVEQMEQQIDQLSAALPELRQFLAQGGGQLGATLFLARAVARRAERSYLASDLVSEHQISIYLNRISDYLFVLARTANALQGTAEQTLP